jgi:iron complex outermembrane receptor protein
MAELFISASVSSLEIYPNPELKPESGWSSELGIKQGIKIGKWMGYLDVAAFLMQYDDMMEFTFGHWGGPTDPFYGLGFKSINVGKTQISGVELSVTGQGNITNNFTVNILAGYTYMNPISLEPDAINATGNGGIDYTYNNSSSDPTILKYRYEHIAKFDTEIKYKKVSLGSSLRYNSFMKNIDHIFTTVLVNGSGDDNPLRDDPELWGIWDGNLDNVQDPMIQGINQAREKYKNGDFIIDARMGYQLNDVIRFGIVVNNLLNREYMTRPATMMTPRTFAFQCNLKI